MPFYIIKTKQNKMDVSVKNRDALNAVLTVKISNEDYASPYEKSLKITENKFKCLALERDMFRLAL